jgi:hypothetical protein
LISTASRIGQLIRLLRFGWQYRPITDVASTNPAWRFQQSKTNARAEEFDLKTARRFSTL